MSAFICNTCKSICVFCIALVLYCCCINFASSFTGLVYCLSMFTTYTPLKPFIGFCIPVFFAADNVPITLISGPAAAKYGLAKSIPLAESICTSAAAAKASIVLLPAKSLSAFSNNICAFFSIFT